MELMQLTAVALGKKLRAGEVSVREAVEAAFAQIESVEDTVGSFVTTDKDAALRRAEQVQSLMAEGKIMGPLAGVPVAVKDNICTRDLPTTCSSRILEGFVPTYNAEVIDRLMQAGAVVIGKTNMD